MIRYIKYNIADNLPMIKFWHKNINIITFKYICFWKIDKMHFQENFHAAKLGHLYMHDVIKRGAIKYKITWLNYSHFLIFQFVCEWSKLSVVIIQFKNNYLNEKHVPWHVLPTCLGQSCYMQIVFYYGWYKISSLLIEY